MSINFVQLAYILGSAAGFVLSFMLMNKWLLIRQQVRKMPPTAILGAWLATGFAALFLIHVAFLMNTAYFGWFATPFVVEVLVFTLLLIVLVIYMTCAVGKRLRST